MPQIELMQLLFLYFFLFAYAIERTVFAFKVPYRTKVVKKPWLTYVPTLTYIILCFIFIIEHSRANKQLNLAISLLGILIFTMGVFFRYGAVRTFRTNKQRWISSMDAECINMVIQNGPYRLVRHPYYLSVLLELGGIALLLNAFKTFLLIFLIQAPLLYKRIIIEESELIKKFSDSYLLYKRRVPAIFPLRSKK